MNSRSIAALGLSLLAAFAVPLAQVGVETNAGLGTVFQAKNTGTSTSDGYGFKAYSVPQPWYGIGLESEGGWKGLIGKATASGSGSRFGGEFGASGGASTNYGVYSSASGGSSNYAGYFAGNVHVSGTFSNPSDDRLKTDVRALDGSLEKVLTLRPATYFFDNSNLPVEGLAEGLQVGVMASDVARVLPEFVHHIPIPKPTKTEEQNANGSEETFQSVNYIGLIPVLVGAIQEQQEEIRALKAAMGK